jgi:Holliday junction resolvase RusA-like endonuclease
VELDGATVVFFIEVPKSWTKRKKRLSIGEPHRQKPDLDNLIKALGDALYGDDSHIASIHASKVWASKPGISIFPKR